MVEYFTELKRCLAHQWNWQISLCLGACQFSFHRPPLIEAYITSQTTPVILPFHPSSTWPFIQYSKPRQSSVRTRCHGGCQGFGTVSGTKEELRVPRYQHRPHRCHSHHPRYHTVEGWSDHCPAQKPSVAPTAQRRGSTLSLAITMWHYHTHKVQVLQLFNTYLTF